MNTALQAPILTSLNEEQLASFFAFMDEVRRDHVKVAMNEIDKLQPYFKAFTRVLKQDLQQASARERAYLEPFATLPGISSLFEAVARFTGNTVMTEMTIAPEDLLKNKRVTDETRQFSGQASYNDHSFTLSFIQAFSDDRKTSVSIPIFALDDRMLEKIAPFMPEALLAAFQRVMTAGNHDMQHHFTNTTLNPHISLANGKNGSGIPGLSIGQWSGTYFGGSGAMVPESYESWLMLNHMRVRRVLEEGPEGKALKQASDVFFEELARIGRSVRLMASEAEAHDVVDYFGTMLCFALLRFVPLDHPLFDCALSRLQVADPMPQLIAKKSRETAAEVEKSAYGKNTLDNYAAASRTFRSAAGEARSYATAKRLQIIQIAPWIARLLGPAKPETLHAEMQARVPEVNRAMFIAASCGTGAYDVKNGQQIIELPDGKIYDIWRKDGRLHRIGGPALTIAEGDAKTEEWHENGTMIAPRAQASKTVRNSPTRS